MRIITYIWLRADLFVFSGRARYFPAVVNYADFGGCFRSITLYPLQRIRESPPKRFLIYMVERNEGARTRASSRGGARVIRYI